MNVARQPAEQSQWSTGSLLGRISAQTREHLLGLGVRRTAEPGETILKEGDSGTHVVLLRHALAKVTAALADGRQALIDIRASGDLVGEMSALNHTPRSATVTICRPSVISIIHSRELRTFLQSHPDAAMEIAGIVADRLRFANQRRVDFTAYPVKIRLARVLVEIATSYGRLTPTGVDLGLQLTNEELATLCGAAEVTLQRALRQLREAGIIATSYRKVMVLDLPRLRGIGDLKLS